MQISNNNINFTSCYKISSFENNNNSNKILDTESDLYPITTDISTVYKKENGRHGFDLYATCSDRWDCEVEKILNNNGINFRKRSLDDIRSVRGIISRIELDDMQKREDRRLVFVNTEKFDKAFENDDYYYIDRDEKQGFNHIEDHINTGRPITASSVILREEDGDLKACFYDGRHRYCVMRNLGADSVPISLDEDSIKIAQKYGMIDRIVE